MFCTDDAAFEEARVTSQALLRAGGGVHRCKVPVRRKHGSPFARTHEGAGVSGAQAAGGGVTTVRRPRQRA